MMSPEDTGNLKWNAIKGLKWSSKNKFTIRYDGSTANYIEYLEEKNFAGGSKKKKNKNKFFIFQTYLSIASDIEWYFNNGGKLKYMKYVGTKRWNERNKPDLFKLDARIKRYKRNVNN